MSTTAQKADYKVADLSLAILRNPYMTNQVVGLDGGIYPR